MIFLNIFWKWFQALETINIIYHVNCYLDTLVQESYLSNAVQQVQKGY